MMQFKTLMVATDFSPLSEKAIDYAVMTAKQFGAKILLTHVLDPITVTTTDALMFSDNSEALRKIAEEMMKNLVEILKEKGVTVEPVLIKGSAASEIISKASQSRVDLIVMGTHGRKGIEHLLLGSVAESVIRSAACPVMVVR